ncbi:MAG: acyl-CoA thioesterase [Ignavibacteriales bacterium]|nr:acyl-CoA thioesterase [Ignavibacteriales bacterium]MCF8305695.1 acyl-CoA thioesterase [Ignavibacteriales bacterium]MCF8315417.1 acyl-CoA thioesterase [Ignavibacteriales bacterium]MCF8436691.1 acyl-CoA thioesterase [Ignavibacteriales bacterium]
MLSHKTQIRVRYADTDKMQFVYNGKYLEYFEVGRTELLRHHGLPYSQVEARGYQLPLIEACVKYRQPAKYDDLLEVEARVNELYSGKVHINYSITRTGSGEIIAEGHTTHMFIKSDTKKPTRPPAFYIENLKKYFPRKDSEVVQSEKNQ